MVIEAWIDSAHREDPVAAVSRAPSRLVMLLRPEESSAPLGRAITRSENMDELGLAATQGLGKCSATVGGTAHPLARRRQPLPSITTISAELCICRGAMQSTGIT